MSKQAQKKVEAEAQTRSNVPPPPTGMLPNVAHPQPTKKKAAPLHAASLQAAASADPAESLTRAAIQAPIDKINESLKRAEDDNAKHGNADAAYPAAPNANVGNLRSARDKMIVLRDWLDAGGYFNPYVSNIVGGYNIQNSAAETTNYLLVAAHWATISTVYHQSATARDSFELTSQAIALLKPLGEQGGRCYMNAFGPFS
jgi:hypothetical protein